jgi:hypothetical protein
LTKKISYTTRLLLIAMLFLFGKQASAQTYDSTKPILRGDTLQRIDSPVVRNKSAVDSVLRVHSPKKAAIRSAILPGWGQIYNKKYWKLPIVYGALGVTGGIFIHNLSFYRELRQAYQVRVAYGRDDGRTQDLLDTINYNRLAERYKVLDPQAIRVYRDQFRSNIDYSVLFFLLFWGLNVVDAAVDAHLKSFDVSPDLSFRIKVGRSKIGGTHGLSLVLAFK